MAECLRLRLLCHFVALRTELHKGASFGVEARNVTIDDRLPDDAEDGPGTKVVFVVKLMHHLHDVVDRKAGVLDVGHLVAAAVFHLLISDETIFLDEVEKLGAGKGMGDGDLNGLAIELLGEPDGVAYGSPGFTGKAEDEITMYDEAKVLTAFTKSRARWTVAPFLIFLRIWGSPDSKPTISSLQPASFIALRVS
jgi:hypothetical protein